MPTARIDSNTRLSAGTGTLRPDTDDGYAAGLERIVPYARALTSKWNDSFNDFGPPPGPWLKESCKQRQLA